MELMYEETQVLRTSDYDFKDDIKVHSLFDIFQDLAGRHAEEIGLGYSLMSKRNLCWVLMSNKMEILGKIPYEKEVTLRTWPNEKGRVDFVRDYEVLVDGEVVVKCSSRWVVINFETRALTRATEINYNGEVPSKKNFDSFKKIKIVIPNDKKYLGSHIVKLNDLDHNGHMNNSKYVEMVYNIVGKTASLNYPMIQIDFLHEALLGNEIKVYTFNQDNKIYYVGYVEDNVSFILELGER